MKRSEKVILLIIALIVIAVLFRVTCVRTVPGGKTGVKVRMGTVQESVLTDGWHVQVPFVTKIVKINNKVLRTDVDGESASKDLQTVKSTVSVNYRVNPESSAYIYKNVGADNEEWENTILRPAVQECVKSVVAKYTAEELITDRENVSKAMQTELAKQVKGYGIEISELNIINFDFSDEFNSAIEAKQTAQQNALKAQQDLERIKVEGQQKITQAEAEAKANAIKNQQITENTLKMKWIEKWDGKLPEVSNGGSDIIMDLGNILK